ncbi:unnamed protein product [Clonostachys byssicola]|uniref:Cytochrome P450 n=1 Tax=Clonostachys byssicola TaxID=160290 RepID=A0A9N9ULZ3_9HYPO|nr:unnamed protein product [Clonostachys byssicola]
MSFTQPWSWTLLALFAVVIWKISRVGRRPGSFPPGPPTLPLIGNLHQIPQNRSHEQFKKWADEYGPIYSLILGTRRVVVLNTDQGVKDMLDKRGSIYSSRPDSHITDIVTGGLSFAMMKYSDTWKMCHRIFQASLSPKAAGAYLPYQRLENLQMLNELVDDPSQFRASIRRYTHSLMTQLVLGFRTVNNGDPKLQQLYSDFEAWSELLGKAISVIVDLYEPLRFLPDALLPVRQQAKKLHQAQLGLFLDHWRSARKRIQDQTSQPCMAQDVLKAQKEEGFSDDLASYICGFLLIAGSDTISTQLTVFLEAMILFPDVQRVAQEELDKVCGDRLPDKDDQANLPYIHAMIKESCRWMPSAILGIPHANIKDDEYLGYKIPKDTVIITNVWAIHNDPNRHKNPRAFDPARYLHDRNSSRQSALSPDVTQRDHFLFGSGRRLCSGMDIAENSLFLSISRILWAFNISKEKDADGNEITPDPDDIVGGLAAMPAKFPAKILPRSEQREKAVRDAWKSAQEHLHEGTGQWNHVPEDLPYAQVNIKSKV